MTIQLMNIIDYTTSDGPGFRTSVYCAGCAHNCKGCQNPQTWNFNAGKPTDIQEIYNHIVANDMSDVTFSGGDPMYQPIAFTELAKLIKKNTSKTIWCYTGFTVEQILKNPVQAQLLGWIDVLVDGKFDENLKDPDLLFMGSSNQRLIDAQASMKQGRAVIYGYEPYNLRQPACIIHDNSKILKAHKEKEYAW
ncbi:MAG: anaerobic ribonucleoside-triphosphate reductase activating protein [Bacteroidales bacterium]|nr:anaerobic ribonucleoside-triphosphate reductase activating protein [Bacteroidales bacterium]